MKKTNLLILLILLIHLLLLSNLRFTAWPEMILWPYFILKGLLPYRDIAIAHNALLIFDLALFYKIFGISLFSLKIYTWILILSTDLLVYWVARKITKKEETALLSLAFYVLWQPYFEGNGVWFDLFLAPLGLLIFYFLWSKEFFWSGIFAGLAILVKQTAFWFIFPIGFSFWFIQNLKIKSIKKFLIGLAAPLLIFLVYLFKVGILQDFYFWAIKFGVGYLPHAPGQIQLPTIKQIFSLGIPCAFVFLTMITLLFQCNGVKEIQKLFLPFLVWCFFTSLGVFPRWGYFHLQPALPFLAVISSVSLYLISKTWPKLFLGVYLILFFLGVIYLQSRFYYLNWQKPDRFFEKETLEVASWLKEKTNPGEKIFILNSWDHLYALSETLPAVSPWVPTLPWYMEYPGIQDEIVFDLQKEKPKIVVFEDYKLKGLGSYKPEKIDKFLQENYILDRIIDGRFLILNLKEK